MGGLRFDHAVIAVDDLVAATDHYRRLGFDAVLGGRHEGFGTENALIRFGVEYIELLAVHNEEAALAAGPNRRALVELLRRSPGAAGFALATARLDALADGLRREGLEPVGPLAMRRVRPDGAVLTWRTLIPFGVAWRRPWPFFIEWDASDTQRVAAEAGTRHGNGIVGVASIGIVVRDLADAVDLYGRRLGLVVHGLRERPDMTARSAAVPLEDFTIELLVPSGPGEAQHVLDERGEGLAEIVLRSSDPDRMRRHLEVASVAAVPAPTGFAIAAASALGVRLVVAG